MAQLMKLKTNFGRTLGAIYGGLAEAYPQIMFGLLNDIGFEARRLMKANLLSGQYIDLRKYPKDSGGHNTIYWSILRKFKGVRITAYPLNLHKPRKAYARFAPDLSSNLDRIVDTYARGKMESILTTKEQEIARISALFD